MENTESLRQAIRDHINEKYDGNMQRFSEQTKTKRQTWYNVLNGQTKHLSLNKEQMLINSMSITKQHLYLLAHPTQTGTTKPVSIRFSEEMIDRLDRAVQKAHLSNRTEVIRLCVSSFLDYFEKNESATLPPNWQEILASMDGRSSAKKSK